MRHQCRVLLHRIYTNAFLHVIFNNFPSQALKSLPEMMKNGGFWRAPASSHSHNILTSSRLEWHRVISPGCQHCRGGSPNFEHQMHSAHQCLLWWQSRECSQCYDGGHSEWCWFPMVCHPTFSSDQHFRSPAWNSFDYGFPKHCRHEIRATEKKRPR